MFLVKLFLMRMLLREDCVVLLCLKLHNELLPTVPQWLLEQIYKNARQKQIICKQMAPNDNLCLKSVSQNKMHSEQH